MSTMTKTEAILKTMSLERDIAALRARLAEVEAERNSLCDQVNRAVANHTAQCVARQQAERERDEALKREADCRQILHTYAEDDDPVLVAKLRADLDAALLNAEHLRAEIASVRSGTAKVIKEAREDRDQWRKIAENLAGLGYANYNWHEYLQAYEDAARGATTEESSAVQKCQP